MDIDNCLDRHHLRFDVVLLQSWWIHGKTLHSFDEIRFIDHRVPHSISNRGYAITEVEMEKFPD